MSLKTTVFPATVTAMPDSTQGPFADGMIAVLYMSPGFAFFSLFICFDILMAQLKPGRDKNAIRALALCLIIAVTVIVAANTPSVMISKDSHTSNAPSSSVPTNTDNQPQNTSYDIHVYSSPQ